jgi:cobalt/nickel transport system permease protein
MTLPLQHLETSASPLGRIDPRWKIAGLVLAAVAVSLLRTWPPVMMAFAGAVFLVFLGRIPRDWYLKRIGSLAFVLTFFVIWLPFSEDAGPSWEIGPLLLSQRGVLAALVVLVKALTILTLMLTLWATAPVDANLKAAYALRVPGLIVQLIMLTYRYLFLFWEEFCRLRNAVRVRGFRSRANLHTYKTVGHVAGTLLVRSYERAERVSQAMLCRGFDGRYRSLATFRTCGRDVVAFLIITLSAAGLVCWDFFSRSGFPA